MKALIFIVPAVALAIGGAAMTGMIQVPGLSPEKPKPKAAAKAPPKEQAKPEPAPPISPPPAEQKKAEAPKSEVTADPDKGAAQVAKLWREIDTPKLLPILKSWSDEDLAPILLKLPAAKTAEVLSALEVKRASKLSRKLQELASMPDETG